jgi:hypothetical protein
LFPFLLHSIQKGENQNRHCSEILGELREIAPSFFGHVFIPHDFSPNFIVANFPLQWNPLLNGQSGNGWLSN